MADATTQNPAGTQTDWEAEAKKLQASLNAVSGERNQYRSKAQAWERLKEKAPDVFKFDQFGNPIDFNVDSDYEQNPAPTQFPGQSPFSGLVDDPSQVANYIQQVVNQQGYMTRQQAEQLAEARATAKAQEAYVAARGDFLVLRSIDKTLGQKGYSELSDYDKSDWSKRTQQILQEKGWGRPMEGAKSWDQWQYASPDAFQTAADIAQAQMFKESQANNASAQQAATNQNAAGLSVGQVGGGMVPGSDDWKKAVQDGTLQEKIRADVERRATQLGIVS